MFEGGLKMNESKLLHLSVSQPKLVRLVNSVSQLSLLSLSVELLRPFSGT